MATRRKIPTPDETVVTSSRVDVPSPVGSRRRHKKNPTKQRSRRGYASGRYERAMEDETWQKLYIAILVGIAVAAATVIASVWYCEKQATARVCMTTGNLATCKQWGVL
jgi:hypothetical protein